MASRNPSPELDDFHADTLRRVIDSANTAISNAYDEGLSIRVSVTEISRVGDLRAMPMLSVSIFRPL